MLSVESGALSVALNRDARPKSTIGMTFPQRRLLGWSVLAACIAAGAAWLLRLDFKEKITTDVLELIPSAERAPEIALVRELASQAEGRTMLFELTDAQGAPAPLPVAQVFRAALANQPGLAQVIALGDTAWRDAIGKELFEQRMPLLFPTWLAARPTTEDLATDVARRLKNFTTQPEAMAFQDLVPADPLLLLPDTFTRLKDSLPLVQPDGGARTSGLVWAQLAVSPLREEGQAPVFAAIEHATAAARKDFPGLRVAYTGVNRFAAASRARIEREVSWLNALSLAAVLAVAVVFIRGAHRALHLAPVVALSVLGAWVATTLVFARVHVIVFVLGALLTGVAIDYGFYLFMQPPLRPDEDYAAKVRRLIKPLLASCFTTVTGFALLLCSELPMIRQLGVFVGAGLLTALGAALAYFATVRNPFLEARAFASAPPLAGRPWARRLVIGLWLAALPGLAALKWRDDIRQLEVPAPALQAEDARIRAVFGQRNDRTVFLSHGLDIEQARTALAELHRALPAGVSAVSLAPAIPTLEARGQAVRFLRDHPDFPEKLRAALEAEGFDAAEFGPFFNAYADYAARANGTAPARIDDAVRRLQEKLPGPLGLLLHATPEKTWFVTLAGNVPADFSPPRATVAASQLQSLNRLFARYRESALRLSLIGLGIVGLGVLLTYGWRDGVRIFAIPCGACLGLFGVLGWLGLPLNLFHLLGAFLGVCLTHNYSIFSATSAFRHEPPPVSVRLSGLTAAASFGVLALSDIPVVHALGVTVAAMVLAALLVIELEHLSPLAKKP